MASLDTILIVEDTLSMAMMYEKMLRREGIKTQICQNGRTALQLIRSGEFSTVLLDLQLPDVSGLEILQAMKEAGSDITFIVITANGSVNSAVDAMRFGAYDFLIKPFSAERMITCVKNAAERAALKRDVASLSQSAEDMPGFLGRSPAMQAVYLTITRLAPSAAPVFITGESGTGKEVTARALHDLGPRRDKPFVAINCAAIPSELMESEIFGHVKGAFTGANEARQGAAKMAHGGTLFLDEICEMDIALQAKLLRFLQTGHVKRVGSDWQEEVDVRIVCATNRDPMEEVAENRFREDLLYRLNVLGVELPPLRSRGDDIVLLAETFLRRFAEEENKTFTDITEAARAQLCAHNWPGNVRELQNTMRKIAVLFDGPVLEADMLSFQKRVARVETGYALIQPVEALPHVAENTVVEVPSVTVSVDLEQPFAQIERDILEAAITHCDGSLPKAAQMLGLSPSTLYRKREGWEAEDKAVQAMRDAVDQAEMNVTTDGAAQALAS